LCKGFAPLNSIHNFPHAYQLYGKHEGGYEHERKYEGKDSRHYYLSRGFSLCLRIYLDQNSGL
jgi:hypothetical protein